MVSAAAPGKFTARLGTAKRLRKSEVPPSDVAVAICNQCGDRFLIARNPTIVNVQILDKHLLFLQEQFVWDHIQENKHRSSIRLPE